MTITNRKKKLLITGLKSSLMMNNSDQIFYEHSEINCLNLMSCLDGLWSEIKKVHFVTIAILTIFWGPISIVYFSLFAMKVFNVRSLNGFATPIHSQLSLKVKSLLSGFVQSNLPHLQMCALLTHSASKHLLEARLSEFYRRGA